MATWIQWGCLAVMIVLIGGLIADGIYTAWLNKKQKQKVKEKRKRKGK